MQPAAGVFVQRCKGGGCACRKPWPAPAVRVRQRPGRPVLRARHHGMRGRNQVRRRPFTTPSCLSLASQNHLSRPPPPPPSLLPGLVAAYSLCWSCGRLQHCVESGRSAGARRRQLGESTVAGPMRALPQPSHACMTLERHCRARAAPAPHRLPPWLRARCPVARRDACAAAVPGARRRGQLCALRRVPLTRAGGGGRGLGRVTMCGRCRERRTLLRSGARPLAPAPPLRTPVACACASSSASIEVGRSSGV